MRASIIRRSGVLASLRSGCHTFFFSSSIFPDTAAAADGQSSKPLSMAEYLVRSWGLSAAEASKVSKLSRGKSTQKADVVLNFLRSEGFEDSYIKKIVVLSPDFIVYDVKNNLAPKLRSFVDMGFSKSDIIEIIASNPSILTGNLKRSILPKLEIWESLFGSRELLVKIVKKNRWCLRYSLEKRIFPNLKFLREELGISEDRVSRAARHHPGFVGQKPESLHVLVDRADEMGIPRLSPLYLWALYILQTVSKEKVEAKRTC
ncbi:transcription termination factor MTERF9, chloroplastic-like [Zingiber officinale]|uniref:transcription termination factor MTERF9, chloroplastic-like n=1 Tax=Zingiber officinale TaxID=94328 RepID=UPI001C4D5573|nr:transcription termination factor MTERF9, chloroplastic-like [Zingiber officinale]